MWKQWVRVWAVGFVCGRCCVPERGGRARLYGLHGQPEELGAVARLEHHRLVRVVAADAAVYELARRFTFDRDSWQRRCPSSGGEHRRLLSSVPSLIVLA